MSIPPTSSEATGDAAFFLDRIKAVIAAERRRAAERGWSFQERTGDDLHTIGDFIGAVLAVDNAADAAQFYASYCAWLETTPEETRSVGVTMSQVAQSNIGWCFGEGMAAARIAMWAGVCQAAHPVFGQMLPTATEAFHAGLQAADAAAVRP